MYCPRCSQQQVSDETIFCSRCGFTLSAVRDLVAGNGEGTLVKADAGAQLSKSERGMRKGVWVMLAGFPLLPIVGLITLIDDVFAVLLMVPVLCFIFGFLRILYGAFLEKRTPVAVPKDNSAPYMAPTSTTQIGNAYNNSALPHPSVISIENNFIEQKRTTAKMVQPPPSVTEHTTKLLDEED